MSILARKSISKYLDLQKHELQIAEGRGQTDANSASLEIDSAEPVGFMQEAISQAKSAWSSYRALFLKMKMSFLKKLLLKNTR